MEVGVGAVGEVSKLTSVIVSDESVVGACVGSLPKSEEWSVVTEVTWSETDLGWSLLYCVVNWARVPAEDEPWSVCEIGSY